MRESRSPTLPVLAETRTRMYDAVFVGAENQQVQHKLSVGYDTERIAAEAPCAVVVVVPKIGGGKGAEG